MLIKQRRIRKLPTADAFPPGTSVVCVISDLDRFDVPLRMIGLLDSTTDASALTPGTQILPAVIGRNTRRNAEGEEVPDRSRPLETIYHPVLRTWSEWHGKDRVEVDGIRYIPYKRYPRIQIAPQGMELRVARTPAGELVLHGPTIAFSAEGPDLIHCVNLLLEIFGECEIRTEGLAATPAKVVRLNWKVLPPGRYPWDRIRGLLGTIYGGRTDSVAKLMETRFATIENAGPAFRAVGVGGFQGYVVFGFPAVDRFVLECGYYGNATYVLGTRWEDLAQLSKAELIRADLHEHRIVHGEQWELTMTSLLQSFRGV